MPIIANIDVDFRLPNAADAIARPLDEKIGESISVLDFGAVGDGVADDTAALQAAIDHALAVGGELVIPRSSIGYRTTATIRAGAEVMTDSWKDIVTRTAPITTWATHQDDTNFRANVANCKPLSVRCEDAIIIPDFEAKEPTPVIEWNPTIYGGQGTWTGRCLIAPPEYLFPVGGGDTLASVLEAIAGGAAPTRRYFGPLNRSRPSNNLIGFAIPQLGLQELANMHFAGLQYGLVAHGAYQRTMRNLRADDCDEAFHVSVGNAADLNNLLAFYCFKGLVFDGTASKVQSFHCQTVVEELIVLAAECTRFSECYWEDAWEEGGDEDRPGQANGTGKYALKLGSEEDPKAGQIIATTFEGIRMFSNRPGEGVAPGKNPLRLWGAPSGVRFQDCRNYFTGATGNDAIFDKASTGELRGCDEAFVALFPRRFRSSSGIFARNAFLSDTSAYASLGEFNYLLPSHNFGSLAAGATASFTFTLPATIPLSFTRHHSTVTVVTGGDDRIISAVIGLSATQATVRVTNPTRGPVTHGSVVYHLAARLYGDAFA